MGWIKSRQEYKWEVGKQIMSVSNKSRWLERQVRTKMSIIDIVEIWSRRS